MKVLIVNKFLYPNGGSETYIFRLGEELQRQGHEVQFFGMEHEGRIVGNHAEAYTSDIDFHTGKIKKLLYPFKIIYSLEARGKIRKVLLDFRPDVVHLNNFNFQIAQGKGGGSAVPGRLRRQLWRWLQRLCGLRRLMIGLKKGRACPHAPFL